MFRIFSFYYIAFYLNAASCLMTANEASLFTDASYDEVAKSSPPKPIHQLCTCGIENVQESGRIFGGKLINPPNRYPWLVALVHHPVDEQLYNCGGSLINRQYVLTAAHCLDNKTTSQIRIAIKDYDSNEPETVQVEKFKVHPNYTKELKGDDIALVKLKLPVDFNNEISPICLPTEKGLTSTGNLAKVAGWGLQDDFADAETFPHEVQVPIVSQASCKAAYEKVTNTVILDTHICAGGELDKDSCVGDSGGPLFIKHNGKIYIVGTVAFSVLCGAKNFPGVYTRVDKYLQWIRSEVADAAPCN